MNDWRNDMRDILLESYKHRISKDSSCAACKKTSVPLAFHVLQKSLYNTRVFPDGFVPMSGRGERISGCYPVCTECSPACKVCALPIITRKVREYCTSSNANYGVGVCEHIHPLMDLKELLFKLFNPKAIKTKKPEKIEVTDEMRAVFDGMLGMDNDKTKK